MTRGGCQELGESSAQWDQGMRPQDPCPGSAFLPLSGQRGAVVGV